jgi:hypothetical protein
VSTGAGVSGCGDGGGDGGAGTADGERRFGAHLPSRDEVSTYAAALSGVGAAGGDLPAAVDLSGELPPIGDQGQLNSCVAWAEGYSMLTYEAGRKQRWDLDVSDHQASPADLYAQALQEMQLACDDGTDPKAAMDLLVRDGIASLAQVSYADSCPLPEPAGGAFALKAWHSVPTDGIAYLAGLRGLYRQRQRDPGRGTHDDARRLRRYEGCVAGDEQLGDELG